MTKENFVDRFYDLANDHGANNNDVTPEVEMLYDDLISFARIKERKHIVNLLQSQKQPIILINNQCQNTMYDKIVDSVMKQGVSNHELLLGISDSTANVSYIENMPVE